MKRDEARLRKVISLEGGEQKNRFLFSSEFPYQTSMFGRRSKHRVSFDT